VTKDGATKTAQALWYTARGKAEIRQETLQPPRPHEVRVRALFGALSRGTEALVLGGRVPRSEFERMRAPFMAGDFPLKYGFATVGEIDGGPAELVGSKVFALHPHQTYFNIPQDAVVPLPESVAPQRAVLAANMETALNAVWDAAPGPADRLGVGVGWVPFCGHWARISIPTGAANWRSDRSRLRHA
jgi:NADPH:quinone reductase-like Zn-dependent oxidoreductase